MGTESVAIRSFRSRQFVPSCIEVPCRRNIIVDDDKEIDIGVFATNLAKGESLCSRLVAQGHR
ncbi:MAG TPA: hypothetical protein VMW69_03730 [Spirochaetia bacterium]|nr:hypothetical protein [Spirochaetia bacterium]